jgi:hypothetical protein
MGLRVCTILQGIHRPELPDVHHPRASSILVIRISPLSTTHPVDTAMSLVHKQAILIHVVLFDELGKLIGFLCVVERGHVHDLISRPYKSATISRICID